jgi:hypothetical protein
MPLSEIQNRNFQSPLNFEFKIDRLTDFNYFIQKINVPSLTIPSSSGAGGNPFTKITYPGDHIEFGELSIDFKIDEGLRTWFDIYSWIQGLGFPEKFEQYGKILDIDGNDNNSININDKNNLYGQGTLLINSSQNNPLVRINFINIYPTSLSELSFDTRETDVNFVTSTVSFKYDYYIVEKIS